MDNKNAPAPLPDLHAVAAYIEAMTPCFGLHYGDPERADFDCSLCALAVVCSRIVDAHESTPAPLPEEVAWEMRELSAYATQNPGTPLGALYAKLLAHLRSQSRRIAELEEELGEANAAAHCNKQAFEEQAAQLRAEESHVRELQAQHKVAEDACERNFARAEAAASKLAAVRETLEDVREALNGPYPDGDVVERARDAGEALQEIGRIVCDGDWNSYADLVSLVRTMESIAAQYTAVMQWARGRCDVCDNNNGHGERDRSDVRCKTCGHGKTNWTPAWEVK